jgi:hypothetical protein
MAVRVTTRQPLTSLKSHLNDTLPKGLDSLQLPWWQLERTIKGAKRGSAQIPRRPLSIPRVLLHFTSHPFPILAVPYLNTLHPQRLTSWFRSWSPTSSLLHRSVGAWFYWFHNSKRKRDPVWRQKLVTKWQTHFFTFCFCFLWPFSIKPTSSSLLVVFSG